MEARLFSPSSDHVSQILPRKQTGLKTPVQISISNKLSIPEHNKTTVVDFIILDGQLSENLRSQTTFPYSTNYPIRSSTPLFQQETNRQRDVIKTSNWLLLSVNRVESCISLVYCLLYLIEITVLGPFIEERRVLFLLERCLNNDGGDRNNKINHQRHPGSVCVAPKLESRDAENEGVTVITETDIPCPVLASHKEG